MGAIFHTNIYYYDNIEEYIKEFPNHNRYAFMLRNASDFSKTVIESPFSLIFGNEASGLPDNFADFCKPIKIPPTEFSNKSVGGYFMELNVLDFQ
jgi:TrmH family RNA methyltransferase